MSKVIQRVGAELYKEAPSTGPEQGQSAPDGEQKDGKEGGEKEPIKGEYEEKKENKEDDKDKKES